MPEHISTIPDDLEGRLIWFYRNYFEPIGEEFERENFFGIFLDGLIYQFKANVPKKMWKNFITREYLPDHIVEDRDQWGEYLEFYEFCHGWDLHSVLAKWREYLQKPSNFTFPYTKVSEKMLKTIVSRWITDLVLQDYSVIFEGERISLDEYALTCRE